MKLFFRKYGSGTPVIILHGLFGMSDNWVTFGKILAKDFTVYIPDQRNHGKSPHTAEFNYSILTEDIVNFYNDHDIDNAVLIGHSMGGKVAIQTALRYPGLIKKLIVLDISPKSNKPSNEILQIIKAIKTLDIRIFSTRDKIKNALSERIEKKKIIEFLLKNVQRDSENNFKWKFNADAIVSNISGIAGEISSDDVFKKPALFIGGDKSKYITGEEFYEIIKYFPEARVEIIKGAGHWLHVDAHDHLLEMVKDFINE